LYRLKQETACVSTQNTKYVRACLAKIGSAFEINNIQRGRVTCCIYEIQSSRSSGEGQVLELIDSDETSEVNGLAVAAAAWLPEVCAKHIKHCKSESRGTTL
jgi:hypothetical protein